MQTIQYNLTTNEFLQKLYGYQKGYALNEITQMESQLALTLPDVLRQYYLQCGQHSINHCLHDLFAPEECYFSHDALEEEARDALAHNDSEYAQYCRDGIAQSDNYFVFWVENQGVWYAGIKVTDLSLIDPPVYMTTNDDLIQWKLSANTMTSFLQSMFWENLSDCDELEYDQIDVKQLASFGIEQNALFASPIGKAARLVNCWLEDSQQLCLCLHDEQNIEIVYLVDIAKNDNFDDDFDEDFDD